jgi:hypothetical protein
MLKNKSSKIVQLPMDDELLKQIASIAGIVAESQAAGVSAASQEPACR